MNRILSIALCMPVRLGRRFSQFRTNRRRAGSHCAPNEEPGALRPSPRISPLRRQQHPHPHNHGPTRTVEPAPTPPAIPGRHLQTTFLSHPHAVQTFRIMGQRIKGVHLKQSTLTNQCLDDWIDEDRASPDSVGTKVSIEVRPSPSTSLLSWPLCRALHKPHVLTIADSIAPAFEWPVRSRL